MKKICILAASIATSFGAAAAQLPENIVWETIQDNPSFASSEAKRGGTLRTHLGSYPLTFRTVGPDSNSGLRPWFQHSNLLERHPDTLNYYPGLATQWAFAGDDKTVYFKLNPDARWNDGEKVTADDFVFMINFMRSKDIVAPWYNNYYTTVIDKVEKIDEYTISISTVERKNKADLLRTTNLQPRPEHFYANPSKDENGDGIHDDYVKVYNYKAEPTPGPYVFDKTKKGKSITFKHVGEDWWGYDNKYNQHRFNVNKIRWTIIRNEDVARQHFEKGDLDVYDLTLPEVWHEKTDSEVYQKGYVQKFWGYNQWPQGAGGLWLNTAQPGLDNHDIRKGIMHATDVDGMIEKLIRGDYSRKPHAQGFGYGEYGMENAKAPAFDVNTAVKHFEKAGYTKVGSDGIRVNEQGQRLSFEFTYIYKSWTPRMSYLQEQAKMAGLEFDLKLTDGSTGFKYISEKKHQVAFINMGTSEVPSYWEYWHSDNANKPKTNNFTNFSHPELDKLIDLFRAEFDIEKKQALSRDIQTIIHESDVVVPSYMLPWTRQGNWRWVKYPQNPMNKWTKSLFDANRQVSYGTYWLDVDVKKETQQAKKEGTAFEPVTVIDDRYKS